MVKLSLLGSFQAEIKGHPIPNLKAQKAKGLLIYLAVEANKIHQREFLMTMLWPGFRLKSAQQNLRQSLYLLRKNFVLQDEPFLFLAERFTISLNSAVPLFLDITLFEDFAGSDSPEDWQQAADLYRGHFLTDLYISDSEQFEEWASNKRAYYLNLAQEVMVKLTSHYIAEEEWQRAERTARRLLELDGLQEKAHRNLIEILARSGRRQKALRHYDSLKQLLNDELGVDPEEDTTRLTALIREGKIKPAILIEPTNYLSSEKTKHNLHYLLTDFIDRDIELPEIESLVTDHRLVMLTGSSGIGKTKLCVKVGWNLADRFPDGVWLVELAPVKDPKFIPQAIASAIGLKEHSGRPIEEILLNVLQENECLLILDNCEHLIDDVTRFAERILRTCPHLKILASSLEAFKIPGEIQFQVPPLSYPEKNHPISPAEWEQYDAIRLFVERAKAVFRDFQITEKNIDSIAQICRRLDGIPLAIEMAAARVNVLSVEEIATRLDDRFDLLVGGNRTAVSRHQTLRSMMEWSWGLLTRPEQDLLKRLSVFVGGMDLQAVEAVATWGDQDQHKPIELLTQLVNKSFVVLKPQPGQENRYYFQETIRHYAQEQLDKVGHLDFCQDCHLDYFTRLSGEAEPNLVGPDQTYYMNKIRGELDNIRAALSWAQETNIESGLNLITSIWLLWDHGYVTEGEMWLERFLSQTDQSISPSLRAKALYIRARFNFPPNANFALARSLTQESLSIYQELDDQQGIAECLGLLGYSYLFLSTNLEERESGQSLLHQSLEIFRSLGDKLGTAETLNYLGRFEGDRNYEEAMIYMEESIALLREVGPLARTYNVLNVMAVFSIWHGKYQTVIPLLDEAMNIQTELGQRGSSYTYYNQGHLYYRLGEYQSSQENLEKTILLSQQTGDKFMENWASVFLGYVHMRLGELDQARETLINCMRDFKGSEIITGVIFSIEGLACLYTILQQHEKAAKLLAWANKTREEYYAFRPPVEEEDIEKELSSIVQMIGKREYSVACEIGSKMTIKQAMGYASRVD